MAEQPDNQNQPEESQEPVVYATPVKRAWAWVGIVYMLIVLSTFTYYLSTARILIGIGPLLLCPALAGLATTAILRYRSGEGKGGLFTCLLFTGLCAVLILINLVVGIPSLLRNFGG